MRVHLITEATVSEFAQAYAANRTALTIWLELLHAADWQKPDDIASTFPSADVLGKGSSRVVFNIAGNKFRMICAYHFGISKVHLYVKWMGTHAAYMRLCNNGLQYTVSDF